MYPEIQPRGIIVVNVLSFHRTEMRLELDYLEICSVIVKFKFHRINCYEEVCDIRAAKCIKVNNMNKQSQLLGSNYGNARILRVIPRMESEHFI